MMSCNKIRMTDNRAATTTPNDALEGVAPFLCWGVRFRPKKEATPAQMRPAMRAHVELAPPLGGDHGELIKGAVLYRRL